jgi:putative ABC transport system permease protein
VPQALPAAGAAGQDLIPIALNQNAAAYLPPLRVGDRAELLVNGQRTAFRVAALVREIGPACAWIPQAALDRVPGSSARLANAFFIRLEPGLAATPAGRAAYAACESALLPLGAKIELALPQAEFDSALGGHIWTLIYALGFMALIIAIVGLLGLAAAMGSSVLERTREIAVMRSIGGTPATIRGLVLGEAGLQALLGLVLALALSLPLSLVLGNLIGMMSFKIPLQTTVDPAGILIWTAILVVGGLAASLLAAGRAAAGSVHAALAYE